MPAARRLLRTSRTGKKRRRYVTKSTASSPLPLGEGRVRAQDRPEFGTLTRRVSPLAVAPPSHHAVRLRSAVLLCSSQTYLFPGRLAAVLHASVVWGDESNRQTDQQAGCASQTFLKDPRRDRPRSVVAGQRRLPLRGPDCAGSSRSWVHSASGIWINRNVRCGNDHASRRQSYRNRWDTTSGRNGPNRFAESRRDR